MRALQPVSREAYLADDYLDVDAARVYEHLVHELDDFDEFARQMIARFLTDAPRSGDLYPIA